MPGIRRPGTTVHRRAVRVSFVAGCVSILAVAFWSGVRPVVGREWTSRSGEHRIEAELVDAGNDSAVLKRTDGTLIRVPFAQLSLGDIRYIHEAMKAAGTLPEPTPGPIPADAAAGPARKLAPASKPSQPTAAPGSPPLAKEGRADWQVAPDPPREPAVIPATAQVRISVPSGIGQENVIFASPGSPFVALGNGDSGGAREMWDLRTGQRVGAIREAITGATKLAISPDGKYLAVVSFQFQGKIRIWSFATGQAVGDLDLGAQFGGVRGLDFAGPDRLVAAIPTEKGLIVWDRATATRVAKVEIYPVPMQEGYAISPGGSYVALVKDNQRIELVDLRNGVHAGDLTLPAGATSGYAPIRVADFSADGREFAVLVEQSQKKTLCCWSLTDGKVVAQHVLSERLPRHLSAGSNARSVAIDWIPGDKGWLIYGTALVDRQQGGPVWVAEGRALGALGRNFRRVVDGQRMVVVSGELHACTLSLEPIPWETISASQRIVAEGGTVADLGLPALTQPDWSAVKPRSLGDEPAAFKPQKPNPAAVDAEFRGVRLDSRLGAMQKICFSAPDVGRVLVNADPRDPTTRRFDLIGAQAGPLSDLYDLHTGQRLAQFDIPFATELLDFSPSGSLGLFRHMPEKDRLDVFDLTTGKHIRGFRPVRESGTLPGETVKWAAQLDDDRLLTLSSNGRLVLWSLKDCRAEYELACSSSAHVVLDASRTFVALGGDGEVHLVECRTGKPCGRLPLPMPPTTLVMSYAAFRQDGQRLAASFYLDEHRRRLIVWDTVQAQILCDLTLRIDSFGLTWTGPDHVALYDALTRDQLPQIRRQLTLIDVSARRVVWKYLIDLGADKTVGPDDRLWLCAMEGTQSRRLIAVALPDPKALEVIATVPPPKPLFGPDTKAVLQMRLGGMPDELEDRRKREDQIDRDLRRHFTDALKDRGVTVAASAPATLTASIKTLTRDELIVFRSRLGLRSTQTIVLAKSVVHARLAIEMNVDKPSKSTVLWEEEKLIESAEVSPDERPQDLPLSAFIHLRQWELARDWCQRTPLPTELFHPDAYRGLGESSILATGIQFVRRY